MSSLAAELSLPVVERHAAADDVTMPIVDAEIDAFARSLNVAGTAQGGGAARLLPLLLDPALDLDVLSERVAAEPGLAIRVLRVANSPFYGHAGTVGTVPRAAQVLGQQALRGIAAAACFDSMTAPRQGGSTQPNLVAFRQHSLAVACAAQALAQRLAPELPERADQAFVAGLLHDMGLLVQGRLRPRRLAVALPTLNDPALTPAERVQTERRHFGLSHADCARRLLAAWCLPPDLVNAVAWHADDVVAVPGDAAELPTLLALADRLAWEAGLGVDGEAASCAELPAADATAPTNPVTEACTDVAAGLSASLQRLSAVFGR